ncbi:flagellar type III secretion system pore protein FliP [Tepidibacillus decaturensis]|uniref:Flagellar biosynthetic protein FliP n=1 Tax=Tepidibacillus decaturensis TaxID=1413211 RepID=A0A135L372_9BACI|nr:flagellar type III secretion system pore protein FliP [Tepidibacillus decaturensis]KXG43400.1 flagellar biosynthesis protein flip [Tepidibacillus decaturensis]
MNKQQIRILIGVLLLILLPIEAHAASDVVIPGLDFNINTSDHPENVATTLQILILLTVLSLAPAILILMTSFTRIVIVLSFVRNALATQQMPPNQVIIGLALFITLYIMGPTLNEVNQNALQPYLDGKISQEVAFNEAAKPFKHFMIKETREKDLLLFLNYSKMQKPKNIDEMPLRVLVPAFAISELKTAFQMGFMIFIPFLIIDMVVASTLMAMGMMMLPPVMISLPFKILLFILVDGWYLVVKSLLESFH